MQTIDWILKCQNRNGGFARSDLGISSFVDTYYAIILLQKLIQFIGKNLMSSSLDYTYLKTEIEKTGHSSF